MIDAHEIEEKEHIIRSLTEAHQVMNPDNFTTFVIGLAGIGVAGFVAWTIGMIIRVRTDVSSLRLYVAENFMKKDDIAEIKRDVRELSHVIFEIAGKLGIPTRKD